MCCAVRMCVRLLLLFISRMREFCIFHIEGELKPGLSYRRNDVPESVCVLLQKIAYCIRRTACTRCTHMRVMVWHTKYPYTNDECWVSVCWFCYCELTDDCAFVLVPEYTVALFAFFFSFFQFAFFCPFYTVPQHTVDAAKYNKINKMHIELIRVILNK